MDKKYKEFLKLINRRNKTKNRTEIEKIDNKIKKTFEKVFSVMITDSSRFSLKTRKYGSLHIIDLLKKINNKLLNIIRKYQGKVKREWADNLVIIFKNPLFAAKCGIEINRFLSQRNQKVKEKDKFNICIGIGYGSALCLGKEMFGDEINITSKLGEDIAKSGEILLTENAYNFLRDSSKYKFRKVSNFKISGITINYYKLIYRINSNL